MTTHKGLINAKRELDEAKTIVCTCSSIALQYNSGCDCYRGKQVRIAQKKIDDIVNSLCGADSGGD